MPESLHVSTFLLQTGLRIGPLERVLPRLVRGSFIVCSRCGHLRRSRSVRSRRDMCRSGGVCAGGQLRRPRCLCPGGYLCRSRGVCAGSRYMRCSRCVRSGSCDVCCSGSLCSSALRRTDLCRTDLCRTGELRSSGSGQLRPGTRDLRRPGAGDVRSGSRHVWSGCSEVLRHRLCEEQLLCRSLRSGSLDL